MTIKGQIYKKRWVYIRFDVEYRNIAVESLSKFTLWTISMNKYTPIDTHRLFLSRVEKSANYSDKIITKRMSPCASLNFALEKTERGKQTNHIDIQCSVYSAFAYIKSKCCQSAILNCIIRWKLDQVTGKWKT